MAKVEWGADIDEAAKVLEEEKIVVVVDAVGGGESGAGVGGGGGYLRPAPEARISVKTWEEMVGGGVR